MSDLAWLAAFVARTRLVKRADPSRVRRLGARALLALGRLLPFPPARAPARAGAAPGTGPASAGSALPRTVWMYWGDGEAAAPPLVRECIRSWRETNPGWEVRVLDDASAGEVVDLSFMPEGTRVQLVADVLRVELLRRHGGVWADATCLCGRPLESWLTERMGAGFFAFSYRGADRPLANWFLAAAPEGRLISAWSEAARAYWRGPLKSNHIGGLGRVDQFIHHYLFEWMIGVDRRLGALWAAAPTLPAGPPHSLKPALAGGREAEALEALEAPGAPVHKLDWRIEGGGPRLAALLAAREAGGAVETTRGGNAPLETRGGGG